jgi:hypothetical protein
MRPFASRLITIGLVAAIAVVGSPAGRAVWESATAQDVPKAEPPPLNVVNEENAKPDFEGEILGVFIGPPERVPDKFVTGKELCGSATTEQVAWDKAGEFDLALTLPESYQLLPNSLNTGVIACGGTVYAARWDYAAPQPNGYSGSLLIARSPFKYSQFDASADRVKATEIGGLPAAYIEPLSPNGVSSAAGLVFPGERVTTVLYSTGIPADELLKVAEIIAAAIAKGG